MDTASKKRILITGKTGQIACTMQEALAGNSEFDLICLGRPEVDFIDANGIETLIETLRPHFVVNAAAYTAVDRAEDEPELALQINAHAAAAVARGAAKVGAPVFQISTDYVFDGSLMRPYREDDAVDPINEYGRSKLAGERTVAAAHVQHIILRTSWIYSPYGANFVKTMLKYGAEQDVLKVVNDQYGNPTAAHEIVKGLMAIICQLKGGDGSALGQTFHFAGHGDTTWCGFAEAIFELSAKLGGPRVHIEAITSSEFPTKAKRPANSRLDCTKFQKQFNYHTPYWQSALRVVLKRLI
jgi:dTDP-4-dehydrorhamnose reductase